jgi:hypothetical protein
MGFMNELEMISLRRRWSGAVDVLGEGRREMTLPQGTSGVVMQVHEREAEVEFFTPEYPYGGLLAVLPQSEVEP